MRIKTTDIPAPEGKTRVTHHSGNTEDIISELIEADKNFQSGGFCRFAQQFSADLEGLRALWKFVRTKIKYKEDALGFQGLQNPAALWASGVGDCKSKTLFINAVLRCIGVPYIIRFTSYSREPKPTHVYTVIIWNGQELPIDAVYDKFGKEAPYTYKLDYDMTMIAHITGTGGWQLPQLKEEQKIIAQKKSLLKKQEYIPFSKLTDGEVKAFGLLRQLEIQKAMNPEKANEYEKAIELTKQTIHNHGQGLHGPNYIRSIPAGLEQYAAQLKRAMKDGAPALRFRGSSRAQKSKFASLGNNPILKNPMYYFNADREFFLARGTEYEKNFWDMLPSGAGTLGDAIRDVIIQMQQEGLLNYMKQDTSTFPPNFPWNGPFTTREMNSRFVTMSFLTSAGESEFKDRIKSASEIYDEWLNQLFEEDKSVGAGFIYAYNTDVRIGGRQVGLNAFPQAAASKNGFHAQWVQKTAQFSGLSPDNIKNLGRNTILPSSGGRQPDEMLGDLLKTYNPNLGEPVTAAIIIGLITAVIGAATTAMQTFGSSGKAREISVEDVPADWNVPKGPALEFVGSDWEGGGAPASAGTGAAASTAGPNTGLLLGGAALALGAYMYSKKNQ